jgi:hypothetical protein
MKGYLLFFSVCLYSFRFGRKTAWSVVIIDEAHRFKRVYKGRDASKMAYEIREIIKDKPKVC